MAIVTSVGVGPGSAVVMVAARAGAAPLLQLLMEAFPWSCRKFLICAPRRVKNVSRVSNEQEWRPLRGATFKLEWSSSSFRAASETSLALASDVHR